MRSRVLVAAALLTVLTGCGGDGSSGSSPEPRPTTTDELARHDGRPCPAVLPSTDGPANQPASSRPELPAFDRAWVCRYQVETWTLVGEPTQVPQGELAALETALAALEPAPADRMCTMDLGPRYLLVVSDGTELTGVVVDAFGCRDVRVAEDPHEAAGPAVFSSPDLLERLVAVAGPA